MHTTSFLKHTTTPISDDNKLYYRYMTHFWTYCKFFCKFMFLFTLD